MTYLIDSNCFIQAKNLWYGFDFCPGYWQWLDQQNATGMIFSLDKVKTELVNGNDELAQWAKLKDASFFLPVDQPTIVCYSKIVAWVNSADFLPVAKTEFAGVADGWLVAYWMAHSYAVVSHEKLNPDQKNRVKIPLLCNHFSVDYCNIFDMLRETGIKLVI